MTSKKPIYEHPAMSALFGGFAGAMEITCTYPTEYTKTVMQLYPEINKKGAVNCAIDTLKARGITGKSIIQASTEAIQAYFYLLYPRTLLDLVHSL